MKRIAPIRLQYDPKTLWFDPGELDIRKGDAVIVNTARGQEFGTAAVDVMEVEDERVDSLKTPLKPVERIATEDDFAQREEMRRLSAEALPIFRELAAETNEDMRPVMVEYLFDGSKAIFLFESEERADFRELVRRLTSRLHVRVDMRQIGVRDEARIIGGLGHCGQELCCRRLGGEFNPVSIRMAKAQDLSLNPASISGVCGRLMCCLRYEYDTYKDFKSRAPKMNAAIHTPEGDFKVCELDTPHETVVLRVDRNKKVRIPLAAFDKPEEGAESQRPKSVGEAYYEYANADSLAAGLAASLGTTERFTAEDKLAEKGMVRHNPTRQRSEQQEEDRRPGRSRRRARGQRQAQDGARDAGRGGEDAQAPSGQRGRRQQPRAASEQGQAQENPRRRRRRGSKPGEQKAAQGAHSQASGASERARHARPGASDRKAQGAGPAQGTKPPSHADDAATPGTHRRTRRRSHKTGGTGNESQ